MNGRALAMQMAQRYGINPDLFTNLVQQESGFNPNAVSPVGAQGFTQIMPATGRDPGYGVKPWDGTPEDNMRFGAEYFRRMLDVNNGDTARALAAYNWGQGNVEDWSGDPSRLPEETRNYVQAIMGSTPGARTPTRTTLAQEAAEVDAPGRNSPVTLDQEKKPRPKLHLGIGLQALGAALSSSARGESAADEIDMIRGRYFEEQDAEAARLEQERARIAAINMVGADTPWGQALASGADPNMVMADYQSYQARQHAEAMQAQGFGHDYAMAGQDRSFQRDMAAEERSWRSMENDEDRGFQWGMAQDEQEHGSSLARDERSFRRGENALDRGLQQGAQDDEMMRWRVEMAAEAEQIAQTQATAEAQGSAYRDLLIEQAEAVGDTPTADWLRTQPPTVFDKDSVEFAADAIVGSDIDQGMRATRQYLELKQTDPAAADAFARSQGWKTDTTTTNTNLSPDTRMNEDGTATIIPGSPTDLEQQRARAKAEADAAEAASKGSTQTDNTLASSKSVVRSIGRSKELIGWSSTGWRQQVIGGIGDTDANQLREELSTVKANIAFDKLAEMRAASPTGGAVGNVTEGELKLLSDTIAALSPSQKPEALRENLDYIEQQYNTILQKIASSNATPEQKREALKAMGADDQDIEAFTPGDDGMLTDPTTGRRYRVR